MINIDDKIRAEYFRRSYEAIDGLWFMKLEEEFDFERALDLDRRVWEIVPKIQSRKLRELLGIQEGGLEGLARALEGKFSMEGAGCEINLNAGGLDVKILNCPWFELMKKSGRRHLAGRVGEVICGTEYPAWAREFGKDIELVIIEKICDGKECCRFKFSK
jgi:hypothetical protein